ncbi:MAG: 3-oxoacyl-ACP synthase III, partial [Pirellulales bacterium]|nr:3-oxoacyl-ACP synthase III [Pirellulales bacterium]
ETSEAAGLLMNTDSETLMHEGVAAAKTTFEKFCRHLGWKPSDIDKTFCHQVGSAHRKLLFETLGLRPEIDYATVEWLGNTGSVALPMTASLGIENGHVGPGNRVGLLGIGSGINVLMLGVEWHGENGSRTR